MGASCGNGTASNEYRDMDKAGDMSSSHLQRRKHTKHDSIEDSVDESSGGVVRMTENVALASPTLSSVPSEEDAMAMMDRIGSLTTTVSSLQKQVNTLEKEKEELKQQLSRSKRKAKHEKRKRKKNKKKKKKKAKHESTVTYQDSSSDIDDSELDRKVFSPERTARDPSESIAATSKRVSLVYRTDTMRQLELNPEPNPDDGGSTTTTAQHHTPHHSSSHHSSHHRHHHHHRTGDEDEEDESCASSASHGSSSASLISDESLSSSDSSGDSSNDEESDQVSDLNTVTIGIKGKSLAMQKEVRELKNENERLKQEIVDFENDVDILMLALCDQEDFVEELQRAMETMEAELKSKEDTVSTLDPTSAGGDTASESGSGRRPSRHLRFSPDQAAGESVSSDPTAVIPKSRITTRSTAASARLTHLSSKSLSRFNRIASAAVRGTVDPSDMQPTMEPLPDSDTEIG